MTEKHDYQTLGEICKRMRCGMRRLKKLIHHEGFPIVKIGGQYMTTDVMITDWINRRANGDKEASESRK